MIVQLSSTSVHVVNPWSVKILEAAASFHITECSTTRTYPWPDSCLGIFSSRKKSLPTCAAISTSVTTSGSFSIRDADGDSLSFSRCEALAPMISKLVIAQWESEEVEGVDDEWRQILEEAAELDHIWGVWEAKKEPTNVPGRWNMQPFQSGDDMRHHVEVVSPLVYPCVRLFH